MTDRQKKICDRYSKRDADGFVHCNECPLVVDNYDYQYLSKGTGWRGDGNVRY